MHQAQGMSAQHLMELHGRIDVHTPARREGGSVHVGTEGMLWCDYSDKCSIQKTAVIATYADRSMPGASGRHTTARLEASAADQDQDAY